MTFALVAVTGKMNIVQMDLVVTRPIVLVWDLKQHFCNMAPSRKVEVGRIFPIYRILHFLDYI